MNETVSVARSRGGHQISPSWPIASVVVAWVVAVALGIAAAGDGVLPGDVGVARWVQRADGGFADLLADFGNWVGAYWTGVGVSLIVSAPLVWTRRWAAVALLVAVAAVRALNNTIKWVIDSPRPTPDLVRVTEDAHGLGFPSGHVSGATLLFGALGWIAWTTLPSGSLRAVAVVVCLAIVPIVSFGRIATGAHWPSDTLGGLLFGTAILGTLVIAVCTLMRWER